MNYPPPNLWTRLEPTIEERIAPEPQLVLVAANLSLPAEWPVERREEFLRRWQES